MPNWVWIVSVILWFFSSCLVGLSVRYIYKAVRILNRAKWSEYAEKYEGFLDTAKRQMDDSMGLIEKYEKLMNLYKTSGDIEGLSETTTKLQELNTNLKEQADFIKGLYTTSLQYAKKGGVAGFGAIQQIEATKNIAIAAVFLAIISVGFSVSSIIISIVK